MDLQGRKTITDVDDESTLVREQFKFWGEVQQEMQKWTWGNSPSVIWNLNPVSHCCG
jgi:preprotein translocase subunit SecE